MTCLDVLAVSYFVFVYVFVFVFVFVFVRLFVVGLFGVDIGFDIPANSNGRSKKRKMKTHALFNCCTVSSFSYVYFLLDIKGSPSLSAGVFLVFAWGKVFAF